MAEIKGMVDDHGTIYICNKKLPDEFKNKLIEVLDTLADEGNTVVVIEHNLDVIKVADHIIDLGPEGGSRGGKIIAEGTPEEVAQHPDSYTGLYLKKVLAR